MAAAKKKEIIVEITRSELIGLRHPHTYQSMLINKLKDAGIPVEGVLIFNGVKTGKLIQEENLEKASYIFRWKP